MSNIHFLKRILKNSCKYSFTPIGKIHIKEYQQEFKEKYEIKIEDDCIIFPFTKENIKSYKNNTNILNIHLKSFDNIISNHHYSSDINLIFKQYKFQSMLFNILKKTYNNFIINNPFESFEKFRDLNRDIIGELIVSNIYSFDTASLYPTYSYNNEDF